MSAGYKRVVRLILAGIACIVLAAFLAPTAGLWPLIPFLFLWNVVDEGLPVRLTDEDLAFIRWEAE